MNRLRNSFLRIVLVISLSVLFAPISLSASPLRAVDSPKEMAFQDTMRKLWEYHIIV